MLIFLYLLGSRVSSDEVKDVAGTCRSGESDRQYRVFVSFGGLESVEAPHASSVQELVLK